MNFKIAGARVAIILVNWNGWRDAVECLSSLFASDATQCSDVFIVDNASSDNSVEEIMHWCAAPSPSTAFASFDGVRHVGLSPITVRTWSATGHAIPHDLPKASLTIIRAGGNLGFAGGNNVGIRAAGIQNYTHFWLLNTDTVIRYDALSHLLERSGRDAEVGMLGSTLIYYHQPDTIQAFGGGTLDLRTTAVAHIGDGLPIKDVPANPVEAEREMAYVIGASMLVTSHFVSRVGLMQDDYFLYFEEIDWALRGKKEFKLAYAPASLVYHKVGGSSSKVVSDFSLNLLYRNRLRFVSRFLPERLAATKRDLTLELLRHVLKGRWRDARLLGRALRDARQLAQSAIAGAR